MKLTKDKIEELARKVVDLLSATGTDGDVCIYYNNKRITLDSIWKTDIADFIPTEKVEEDVSPLDYFEYANPNHILSMSFEGALYHALNGYSNGSVEEKLDKLFEKYGLYYELGHAWNLTVYPVDGNYDDIEYTSYKRKQEPKHIYMGSKNIPVELQNIMVAWYELSKKEGDIGSCVIGAGYNFEYDGIPYFMSACSPYQGSMSWESGLDTVRAMLKNIGATDIRYNYGVLD